MCLLALSSAYGVPESNIRDNWSIFWSRGLIPQISYYPIKNLFRYLRIRESNVYVVFVLIHTIQAGPLGALTRLNRWSESFQACPHPFNLINLKSQHTLGHVFHNIYNNPKNKREGWPWLSCGAIIGL